MTKVCVQSILCVCMCSRMQIGFMSQRFAIFSIIVSMIMRSLIPSPESYTTIASVAQTHYRPELICQHNLTLPIIPKI